MFTVSTHNGWPSPMNSSKPTKRIFWLVNQRKLSNCWTTSPNAQYQRIDSWTPATTCGCELVNFSRRCHQTNPFRMNRSKSTNRCIVWRTFTTLTTRCIAIWRNRLPATHLWHCSIQVDMWQIRLVQTVGCRRKVSACCKSQLPSVSKFKN